MNEFSTKLYCYVILSLLLFSFVSFPKSGTGQGQRVEETSIQGFQSATIDGFLDLTAPSNHLSEWGDAKQRTINLKSGDSAITADLYTKAVYDQIMIGFITDHPLSTVSIQIDFDNSGDLSQYDVLIVRHPNNNNDIPESSTLEILVYDMETAAFISPASLLSRDQSNKTLDTLLLSTGQILIDRQPNGPVIGRDNTKYGFEANFNPLPVVNFLAEIDPSYESAYRSKDIEKMELNYAVIVAGNDEVGYGFPNQPITQGNNLVAKSYITDFYPMKINPSWTADVGISNIELSQSVQFADNSLRLVDGKATLARVYVNHNKVGTNVDVKVELTARRISIGNGITAYSAPLVLTKTYSAPATPGSRSDPTQSVNFLLPAEWMTTRWVSYDYLIVKATVTPLNKIDTQFANNEFTRAVTLTLTHNLNIYWVNVNNALSESFIKDRQSMMERMYPVSHINWIELDPSVIGPFVGNDKDLIALLNGVVTQIIYAILNGITYNGQGFAIPDQIMGFWLGDGTKGGISDPKWSWPGRLSFASTITAFSSVTTAAHEVNHNLGDAFWGKHVGGLTSNGQVYGCGVDDPDPLWQAFYTDGKIHALGMDPTYGLISSDTSDFMTYCSNRWISDYRWELLINKLSSSTYIPGSPQLDQVGTPEPGTTVRLLSGSVDPQGGIKINPSFEVPGIAPVVPQYNITDSPEYRINVSYTNGSVVTYPVYTNSTGNGDNPTDNSSSSFTFILPDNSMQGSPQSISQIDVLAANDSVVYHLFPTGYTTNLEFSIPNYISRGTNITISWNDLGTSRKPLYYLLQYSHDNTTWQNIGTPSTELTVNTTFTKFPGGDGGAYFRVIVTDGFETNVVYSPSASSTSDLSPNVSIQGNYENTSLNSTALHSDESLTSVSKPLPFNPVIRGSTIGFKANAVDPEDGPITTDGSFTWSIYDDAGIKLLTLTGSSIEFRIFKEGNYIAEVQVTDSAGNTDSSRIQFTITTPKQLSKDVFASFISENQNTTTSSDETTGTSRKFLPLDAFHVFIALPVMIILKRRIRRN